MHRDLLRRIRRQLDGVYESARNPRSSPAARKKACNAGDVEKHPILKRSVGVLFVSLAFAVFFYVLAHDVRMSAFIFLVTAFAGSMFAMISVVTKES
jgi:hypothetical protein